MRDLIFGLAGPVFWLCQHYSGGPRGLWRSLGGMRVRAQAAVREWRDAAGEENPQGG